jgi:predicted CoA-binding protein
MARGTVSAGAGGVEETGRDRRSGDMGEAGESDERGGASGMGEAESGGRVQARGDAPEGEAESGEKAMARGDAPGDDALRDLLRSTRSIAVLGIKSGDADEAFRVPRYLQARGYRILPVNPKLDRVLGEPAVASLADVSAPYELLDVFRAPAHLPAHVDEILALASPPRAVWFQEGIRDDRSAARLREAGIQVIQDRCLMVEHARLLGPGR